MRQGGTIFTGDQPCSSGRFTKARPSTRADEEFND
jgi:hypothetical protein